MTRVGNKEALDLTSVWKGLLLTEHLACAHSSRSAFTLLNTILSQREDAIEGNTSSCGF